MRPIELMYQARCEQESDINKLLPILRTYAGGCNLVTEFGVRYGNSTAALLAAEPTIYTGYDLIRTPQADSVLNAAPPKTAAKLIIADTKHVKIDRCDMLFIDTFHNASQLSAELMNSYRQVGQVILLHDTETYGVIGEDGSRGLTFAVDEFLAHTPSWAMYEHYHYNNGLTVLKRVRNDD